MPEDIMNIQAPVTDANAVPLETLDMSDPTRFQDDTIWPFFARLRKEDPVHFCQNGMWGPFWSITRYNDIMTVDTTHEVFSSEPVITLFEPPKELLMPMFIAMDQPKHDEQRKAVQGIVQPPSLAKLEGLIRERVIEILDGLPKGEVFDWVPRVSIELTTRMLATLFDFPFEDRKLLTYWSDTATMIIRTPEDLAFREAEMQKCLAYFVKLWNERVNAPPANNLISMLAHNPATKSMGPREYLGNILLLIVGGNDTTRNTISASLYYLNKNPGEYDKLRADPSLIPNMVAETIRYQTPLSYMRRTAKADFELGGKIIKAGDKVAMWFISGNRDDAIFEDPDRYWIDRPNARRHMSFGFGIHRCMGNRLGELQLKILWEELLKRHPRIDVVGEPQRVLSAFVHGYSSLPVRIPA
jgi:cytochrome P450